jgi:chromosome partitioning protein
VTLNAAGRPRVAFVVITGSSFGMSGGGRLRRPPVRHADAVAPSGRGVVRRHRQLAAVTPALAAVPGAGEAAPVVVSYDERGGEGSCSLTWRRAEPQAAAGWIVARISPLMAKTLAVVNQKGGTGKTTTVANLAVACAERGRRVLAVDVDPQASLTFYFGHDERALEAAQATLFWALTGKVAAADMILGDAPGLLPASIALAKADVELMAEPGSSWVLKECLAPLRDRFDLVLLDCPPTLTLLTVNALAAADTVLIPVKTDLLSTLGISQLMDTVQKVRRRANPALTITGILPTLYNARFAHDSDVLAELEATYGAQLRVFEPIRRTTLFDRAAGTGRTTVTLDPSSEAAVAYATLAATLEEIFDEPPASSA